MALTPRRAISSKEILVVLVVIALLMAVAIPNFMRSRTRAKIAMVREDLRSLAVAVESYLVDHGNGGREYSSRPVLYGDPVISPGDRTVEILHWSFSTPVAYLPNAWIKDPFASGYKSLRFDRTVYTYHSFIYRRMFSDPEWTWRPHLLEGPWPVDNSDSDAASTHRLHYEFYGKYRLGSVGPDGSYFNNPDDLEKPLTALAENIVYDPTNGLYSQGNIWTFQRKRVGDVLREGETPQPPIQPGLLGAH